MKKASVLFPAAILMTMGFAGIAPVSAASVVSDYSKIKTIGTYAGDTTVFLEKNPLGCEQGFWMRPDQAGFKEKLDQIEKAAHAKVRVKISGDGTDLWSQLELRNCRLESISMEPVTQAAPAPDNGTDDTVDTRKETEPPLEDKAPYVVKE